MTLGTSAKKNKIREGKKLVSCRVGKVKAEWGDVNFGWIGRRETETKEENHTRRQKV